MLPKWAADLTHKFVLRHTLNDPETEGTSAHPSCQLASARVPGGGVPKGIQVG